MKNLSLHAKGFQLHTFFLKQKFQKEVLEVKQDNELTSDQKVMKIKSLETNLIKDVKAAKRSLF